MKKGDKVIFIGSSIEQTRWGSNDDPYKVMKEGDMLEIENVEVHSWHTKLSFVGIEGKFNCVCFKHLPSYINPNPKKVSEADLKKALKELHEKQEAERRQAQIDLNNAFRDGFRCNSAHSFSEGSDIDFNSTGKKLTPEEAKERQEASDLWRGKPESKTKTTDGLLPCPFCESKPLWINESLQDNHYYIKCPHCHFVMREDRRDKVIGFWNRREYSDQQLAAFKEKMCKKHLQFIYARLLSKHAEHERIDYMIKFKEIIDQL